MRKPYPRMIMNNGAFLVDGKPTWSQYIQHAWVMTRDEASTWIDKLRVLGYDDARELVINPETREFLDFMMTKIKPPEEAHGIH